MSDSENPNEDLKIEAGEDPRKEFDPTKKTILDNNFMSGITVPLLIVVIGAGIIFGVTKMLSSGRTHRDLVIEMQSKTFGNRWVAAYELSKLVARQSIPREEIPWLIENLAVIFDNSVDQRTRNFIILTFGSLKHRDAIPYIEKAIDDPNKEIAFNALVGVGNLPPELSVDWSKVMGKLDSEDEGLRHAAILALATRKIKPAQPFIEQRLNDNSISVRFAAATALINYRSEKALPTIREILELESNEFFNPVKLQKLKLGVLSAIGRERWIELRPEVEKLANSTEDLRLETTARQVLGELKN